MRQPSAIIFCAVALPLLWSRAGAAHSAGQAILPTAAPAIGIVLEMDRAIELALANNRELALLEANVKMSAFRLDSAGIVRNPKLRVSELSTRYFSNQVDEMRIGLRWNPPRLGELAADGQEASVRHWEQKVKSEALIEKIDREITDAYAIYAEALLDWVNFSQEAGMLMDHTQQILRQNEEFDAIVHDELYELKLVMISTRKLLVEKQGRLYQAKIELLRVIGAENEAQLQ